MNAYRLFFSGEDKHFPGGLANGVGEAFPEITFTKCGTTFVCLFPFRCEGKSLSIISSIFFE